MRLVVIAGCVVAVALGAYGVRAAHRHLDRIVLRQQVRAVEVDSGTGGVEVVGTPRTHVVVTHAYHYALGRPSVRRTLRDGVLRVSSRCSRFDFACTVRTRLEVPAQTRMTVRVETGGVDVRRLRAGVEVDARDGSVSVADSWGPVRVTTGTGLVTLEQLRGSATVRTDNGDVVLADLVGAASVTTHEGDIRGTRLSGDALDASVESGIVSVAFARPPAHVSVRTDVGGVAVRVPTGLYAVRARTDAGRVRITGISQDRTSSRVIVVRAGAGDVAIRGRAPETAADRSPR